MNRVLYAADCLNVLYDTDKLPDGSVDLIYLDPPFNSNSAYNLPSKSRDRSLKPVEAFVDTWTWRAGDEERLRDLEKNPKTRPLATIVKFAREIDGVRATQRNSMAAYLLNMALRLYPMKRVLKDSGSIYLHCDPFASHYLKLVLDGIFGRSNLRNEVIWNKGYRGTPRKRRFQQEHDTVFFYTKSDEYTWNKTYVEYKDQSLSRYNKVDEEGRRYARIKRRRTDGTVYYGRTYPQGKLQGDVVDIPTLAATAIERLGYPTQKPLALMERIIEASSNEGDLVLDPFCGCGTTVHAAEKLGRKWIGIDISRFSTGLIRRRIVDNFAYLNKVDIFIEGTPETVAQARDLARHDKFEFEKWVCGAMDANGMYRNPGEKGADGGVDGVVELPVIREAGGKYVSETEYVIIQVKGGKVSPDSVKALSETVRRLGAIAGILVCFKDQMGTVENQRGQELWSDAYKQYPVIQGFSIEDLLAGERPNLPPTWGLRHGGRTSAVGLL